MLGNALKKPKTFDPLMLDEPCCAAPWLSKPDPASVDPRLKHGASERLRFIAVDRAELIDGLRETASLNEHLEGYQRERVLG